MPFYSKPNLVASSTANRAFCIRAFLVNVISVDNILRRGRRAEPASARGCRRSAAGTCVSLVQVTAFAVKVIPSARALFGVPSAVDERGICRGWYLNGLDWLWLVLLSPEEAED